MIENSERTPRNQESTLDRKLNKGYKEVGSIAEKFLFCLKVQSYIKSIFKDLIIIFKLQILYEGKKSGEFKGMIPIIFRILKNIVLIYDNSEYKYKTIKMIIAMDELHPLKP